MLVATEVPPTCQGEEEPVPIADAAWAERGIGDAGRDLSLVTR